MLIALALVFASIAAPGSSALPTFPAAQRDAYAAHEAAMLASVDADRLKATHASLASEPHVAGTPGDLRNIERLVAVFTEAGLEVERHEFFAYMPRPVSATLQIVAPVAATLVLKENILAEDPDTANPDLMPGWNAYSASGDVTAEVVYANYGTKTDFEKLKELGIDCRGKIAIARYGGNFRGFKARFAQLAGAAGLIIYTDPGDSGYAKGIAYPEGTYSNDTCIERGSLLTLPYPGDPLTPGVEATRDAARLDPEKIALPRIPVQPVGWGAAKAIMEQMKGAAVPQGWQGGLPFAYRVAGGDGLKVRLKVEQKSEIIRTCNVIATLKGSSDTDHEVVIGCHHDAWGFGTADPLCGTMTLVESARVVAAAAKGGHAPVRTIRFCAWGAEEFGIIGSTEWVEANADRLRRQGVAYINLDMASMGIDFGSSASPALRPLIADAARAVGQPRDTAGKMVFDSWLARSTTTTAGDAGAVVPGAGSAGAAAAPPAPQGEAGRLKFGDLGGGSDHVGFLCLAGVASCSLGGGGSHGNSYHTTYDTIPWYIKTVGADYAPAVMVTRMTVAVASRLAESPVLPLDHTPIPSELRRHAADIAAKAAERKFAPAEAPLARLSAAAGELESVLAPAAARLAARIADGTLPAAQVADINARLLAADRAWLDDAGLPGRPWYRNLYAAPDEDSGYAAWTLPGLRHALEVQDPAGFAAETERLIKAIERVRAAYGAIAEIANR